LSLETRKQLYQKLETGFTMVFMVFLSVVTLSVMVFVANMYRFSGLNEVLAVSPSTPWGVVTSLFVHADEAHLFSNMIALFLFLLLLVGSNVFLPKEEIKRRILDSMVVIFPLPIVLNLLVIFTLPSVKMIGSSAIVYALEGRCLGYAFLNALELRKVRTYAQNKRKMTLASSLSNLIVFVGFILNLVLLIPALLQENMLTAVLWVHIVAIGGGYLTVLLHEVQCRLSLRASSHSESLQTPLTGSPSSDSRRLPVSR